MIDLVRINKFVRLVHKYNTQVTYNHFYLNVDGFVGKGDKDAPQKLIVPTIAVEMFADKYVLGIKMGPVRTMQVFGMAMDYGYVELKDKHVHIINGEHCLQVTNSGYELISRPFGLLQALLSKFGLAISFLTGAIFTSLLFIVLKFLLHTSGRTWHILARFLS